MRYIKLTILMVIIFNTTHDIFAQSFDVNILGRWDISIEKDDNILPSWLEVQKSGHETLVGRFVYAFGSARPISEIKLNGNEYQFSIPRQWEPMGQDMNFEFQVLGDELAGTMVYTDGNEYSWTAARQAKMEYVHDPQWGDAQYLFAGNTLDSWGVLENSNWDVVDGILTNSASGANLITKEKFTDFKLHIECRIPKDGNSGIYLRGRHEVQVADDYGKEPGPTLFGAIYGFITPNEMVALPAGEWQTFDITLIANRVTVEVNGKLIIVDQVIPGITGGALDCNEGEPGPLMLQGDHGPIEYKNIFLVPRI